MSRKKRNWQVRQAFDRDALARLLTAHESDIPGMYGLEVTKVKRGYGADDFLAFKDNGASVLAVAHLDTVVDHKERKAQFTMTSNHGLAVVSGSLDDRLGAYTILELLPKLGVTHDILLTTAEESCASTAYEFETDKSYNWVIEFDRMGTDVVMYQYEDKALIEAVEAAGAEVGQGSFSDIAALEHLNVKALNWGIGYYGNYHSVNGYALLNDTFAQVDLYRRFHALHAGTVMPHKATSYQGYRGLYESDSKYEYVSLRCWYCNAYAVDLVTAHCGNCTVCQDCGEYAVSCECYIPKSARESAAVLLGEDDDAGVTADGEVLA